MDGGQFLGFDVEGHANLTSVGGHNAFNGNPIGYWDPDGRFSKGAIEGVAAPESANNAAAQACFIPMLSLGIPPNALMALMIGAMMVHGITPGPEIIT